MHSINSKYPTNVREPAIFPAKSSTANIGVAPCIWTTTSSTEPTANFERTGAFGLLIGPRRGFSQESAPPPIGLPPNPKESPRVPPDPDMNYFPLKGLLRYLSGHAA